MYDSNIQIRIERYKKTSDNFNSIRFKPYRIASKLKFLRNESKFYLIDLYNTIESFREFGLNSDSDLNAKIQLVLYSIFHHLSRRSSSSKDVDIDYSVALIYNWLLETFNNGTSEGFINVLAFKISLILLCSSLLSNKLKYFFTLLSNENGFLDEYSFSKFLRYTNEICNHFENEHENFDEIYVQHSIFNFTTTMIDLKHFIEVLTNFENQDNLISWIIIYHRLFDSENVVHNIQCDSCNKNPLVGFRYKCKICHNYNQCQDCFWTGKSSKNHDPDFHPCKEYLFDKSRNHLRQSFRRSFRKLLPKQQQHEENESALNFQNNDKMIMKKLNLSNIISPQVYHRNKTNPNVNEFKLNDLCFDYHHPEIQQQLDNGNRTENEHLLIEHYLNILRDESSSSNENSITFSSLDNSESYEKIISELEQKNRQLMLNISELSSPTNKQQQERNFTVDCNEDCEENFFAELSSLRKKKTDLETYLTCLQDRRKNLMFQLDDLMKELTINNH
ncbi:dystrobrevin alpha-like protein [Euroglyphus maynei]|uniref:Dystrobrevin alpha-like protein n=1 Tax=Euroglyphus maynei TaxID=6958 RepID=A0A1Y3BG13_EURMA|nr:dystrobrevin alpha-like protein [Euroglyphus maynei]